MVHLSLKHHSEAVVHSQVNLIRKLIEPFSGYCLGFSGFHMTSSNFKTKELSILLSFYFPELSVQLKIYIFTTVDRNLSVG